MLQNKNRNSNAMVIMAILFFVLGFVTRLNRYPWHVKYLFAKGFVISRFHGNW